MERTILPRDLKFVGYRSKNNFVGTLKIMSNAATIFYILATSLNVLRYYFDKITFPICVQLKFQQNHSLVYNYDQQVRN